MCFYHISDICVKKQEMEQGSHTKICMPSATKFGYLFLVAYNAGTSYPDNDECVK